VNIIEKEQDLFACPLDQYYFAHCISSDFALGAGIAVQFDKKFDMRHKLIRMYPKGYNAPGCILIDRTFNLVTKNICTEKPTYNNLTIALNYMRSWVNYKGIYRIAMPRIGCGRDKLSWDIVRKLIETIFSESDTPFYTPENLEIMVCYINEKQTNKN